MMTDGQASKPREGRHVASVFSMVSRGAVFQFWVAFIVTTLIPVLVLTYMDVSNALDYVSPWLVKFQIAMALVMMGLGWLLLYRYPLTIAKLRRYFENTVAGQMPGKIHLVHSENDVIAIEKSFNMILDQLNRKVESITKQMLEISEKEQRRIGRDLHDGLGQSLSGIAFKAKVMQKRLLQLAPSESQDAEAILILVNDALTQAQNLAKGLCPVRTGENGLVPALEELAQGVQKTFGVICHVSADAGFTLEDDQTALHIYRIAQEAINNAAKHSKGRRIDVLLSSNEGEVTLLVRDDGIGLPDGAQTYGGMGMGTMRYRASQMGATIDIMKGAGGGSVVVCTTRSGKAKNKVQTA